MTTNKTARKKSGYHHGDLRSELIEATRRLLVTHDPSQVRISEACRLAGVSTAAPYRHFESREDLFEAVAIDGMQRMGEQMQQVLSREVRGSEASITALGKAYLQFARTEPNLFRMIFRRDDDEERAARLEAAGTKTYGVLLNEIAVRLGMAVDAPQVLEVALPLWAFVHGTASLMIDDHLKVAQAGGQIDQIDQIIVRVTRQLLGDTPMASGPDNPNDQ